MKKIYLVRHGETLANAASLVQDGNNELSPKGHAQVAVLANRLKKLDFKNLIVSDYVRTKQTAAALVPYIDTKPKYSALVREVRRPSELIGKSRKGSEVREFEALASANIANQDWHFSDEENFFDVVTRVRNFFKHVDELNGDTLVITHGRFIIYIIMCVIMQDKLTPEAWPADIAAFTKENTGITVLTYKEDRKKWALTTYNDHAHFAE